MSKQTKKTSAHRATSVSPQRRLQLKIWVRAAKLAAHQKAAAQQPARDERRG